jgi:homoserine dehydrogenase
MEASWFTIHPKVLCNLEGKDNIVLFFTDRYIDQPLLIKGCMAEVTASGILLMLFNWKRIK